MHPGDTPAHISLEFEPGPSAASSARHALYAIEGRVEPNVMEDVKLLVSELVTNSVRHAGMAENDHVELDVSLAGDTLHVQVGDGDTGVGQDLRRVEAGGPAILVLDLTGLEFMDSTGLRLLISADARAREAGRRLAIVQGNEMVQRVMRLTRLDERLDIVEDASALTTGS